MALNRDSHTVEKFIERLLSGTRWLLAPIYLGLSLALVALGIMFFMELFHLLMEIGDIGETDLVLGVLTLVDLSLVASLLIMVMFSSYENFVSALDTVPVSEQLGWIGKLDAGALKLKVATSIVAISSIHLLKAFMDAQQIDNDKLMWFVIIHLTFVVSALLMGLLDRITLKH